MRIDNNELRQLLPHAGFMCLLDGVSDWNETAITCTSRSHREPNNPLRQRDGRLAALHAFEYAAQAVAIHGGLLVRQQTATRAHDQPPIQPPLRYLAALKNGRLHVDYLDAVAAPLEIVARQLLGDIAAGQFIYDAQVSANGELLAAVRVSVMGNVAL